MNDEQSAWLEVVAVLRNRTDRVDTTNAAGQPAAHIASPSAGGDSQTGYWNGSGYQSYFLVGISLLGGTDVLK